MFKNFYNDIDRYLAIIGTIIAIFLMVFFFILHRIDYIIVGFLLFLTCLSWIFLRKEVSIILKISWESKIKLKICYIVFSFLFILSTFTLYFQSLLYHRPLAYYVLAALMAGIIAIENIFSSEKEKYILFFQMIVLGFSIVGSQVYLFPSLVGVDPWEHQNIILTIIESHFIPYSGYSYLPNFHIFFAESMLLTGLDFKASALLCSFVQLTSEITLIYLICILIIKNHKVGIFSSLLVIIANYPVYFNIVTIPNSFSIILLLTTFYILLNFSRLGYFKSFTLSVILMLSIIFTHPITTMYLAICLVILYSFPIVYSYINKSSEKVLSIFIPIFFVTTMVMWWTFASGSIMILARIFDFGFASDSFAKTPNEILISYLQNISLFEQIFNQLGHTIFFALSFIGTFYLISRKDLSCQLLALIGILPLTIGFSGMATGTGLLEQRWFFFAQILLSISVSLSLIIIFNRIRFKYTILNILVIFTIFFSITLLMILSPTANIENPPFSQNSSVRYSFTQSELVSIQTISTHYDKVINTDEYFSVSGSYIGYNTQSFNREIHNNSFENLSDDMILIRNEIIYKLFKVFSGYMRLDYDIVDNFTKLKFNKIYDCKTVFGYST